MNGGGNQKPKSNWQSDLGDFLQNALVGTAAALVPGFGIGFAESQQAEREAEMKQLAAREKALFTIAGQAANLGNVAGVEALAPLFQDQQIAQAFLGQAQQTQRLIGGAPGAFVPTAGAEGETRELVTPTGGIVRAGEVGVRPPPEPQFEPTFTPSGTRFAPIPAEKLRFRKEEKATQQFLKLQDANLAQGLPLASAQANAVHQMRLEGLPIPKDLKPLLRLPITTIEGQQVPSPEMQALGTEVETRGRAALAVPKRPSTRQQEAFATANAAFAGLSNIANLIRGQEANIGPAAGRFTKLKEAFGRNPRALSQLATALRQFKQQARFALTGAQASFKEIEEIEKAFPRLTDTPEKFQASLIESTRLLKQRLEAFQGVLRSTNILAPDFVIPEDISRLLGGAVGGAAPPAGAVGAPSPQPAPSAQPGGVIDLGGGFTLR